MINLKKQPLKADAKPSVAVKIIPLKPAKKKIEATNK